MIRWLGKGDTRLQNWNRRGLLSVLSLTNSHWVRCFGREGLSKAASMFREKHGNVDWTKKTAEAGGVPGRSQTQFGDSGCWKSRGVGQLG